MKVNTSLQIKETRIGQRDEEYWYVSKWLFALKCICKGYHCLPTFGSQVALVTDCHLFIRNVLELSNLKEYRSIQYLHLPRRV